jgi:hypothetical protein
VSVAAARQTTARELGVVRHGGEQGRKMELGTVPAKGEGWSTVGLGIRSIRVIQFSLFVFMKFRVLKNENRNF